MAHDMILPDRVDSPWLVLREWEPSDAPALSAAIGRNLEHLRPWMPWVQHEPLAPEDRVGLITGWHEGRLAGGDALFGIFIEGAVVGGCGLHRRRGPHGLEIGYWVDRDHTGRGVATEAARLLTTTACSMAGVTFVEIHHDQANTASRRIPEHLGYRLVGEAPRAAAAPGEVGIECTWRVEAEGWAASDVRTKSDQVDTQVCHTARG